MEDPNRHGLELTGGSRACKPPDPGLEHPKTFLVTQARHAAKGEMRCPPIQPTRCSARIIIRC
jgi:uncharacterized Zn-finger protein